MPSERDAITVNLGDACLLIAAGVRREKNGDLSADLMLKNGKILSADRAVLNTEEGRIAWATEMAARVPDGPAAERMAGAIVEHLLPEALAVLQEEPAKSNQADMLVGLVTALGDDFATDVAGTVELFHDPGGIAYARMPVDGHHEVWPLRSRTFREWLARCYHEQHGKTPNAQALTDATNVLSGQALFDGPEHPVHLRLAMFEGVLYLDRCDPHWEAIAIDGQGWRIEPHPPVRFRRTRGMLPLPVPTRGGSLTMLRRFVNLPTDTDDAWILILAWLVAALRPDGPFPILVTHGEQGAAKSTLQRLLRALIDPNKAALRSLPRDE